MMERLILHERTRKGLEQVIAGGAHAIMIEGTIGSGKETLAHALAQTLLGADAYASAPYFKEIYPDDKTMTIEQIRDAQKFLQLKTTGNRAIRRVIIFHSADSMSIEAQNALLKILEEPPLDTVLILTIRNRHNIKPTIHSRVQQIGILPPARAAVIDYFTEQGFSKLHIERAFMLSNGSMGLMTAILNEQDDHQLNAHIQFAKQLYGMSAFERLKHVEEISKDKTQLPDILFACKRICLGALEGSALKNQSRSVVSWHKQLKLILDCEAALPSNPNTKLLLTNLFLHM